MPARLPAPPYLRRFAVLAAVAVAGVFVVLITFLPGIVGARLRAIAARRDIALTWRALRLAPPFAVAIDDLRFLDAQGDTALTAGRVEVALDPLSVLALSPRPDRFRLSNARIDVDRLRGRHAAVAETTTVEVKPRRRNRRDDVDHLPALRRNASAIVRILTLPAGRLPKVELANVSIATAADSTGPARVVHFDTLRIARRGQGTRLLARGQATLESPVRFDADFDYGRDERLTGAVVFRLPVPHRAVSETLHIGVEARLAQERSPHGLLLADGSVIRLGRIPLAVSGFLTESGPHLRFALATTDLRPGTVLESFPRSMLGPLADVALRGSFDYRLRFDLDLAHPDRIDLDADVVPHGLAIDPARTRLRLLGLGQPFTAAIHLPKGRIVPRDLSEANPHYLPLAAMDSVLAHAVVTNEDGGFFRHNGFSTEAVKDAIVENLKAGRYQRGAGTISMQLARNLYLGHERALARKGQEVVLAWILEHLTGAGKRRLLEIYLNIIEWGPGVHGADEAAHYYFGHDARSVTVDEALFLSTVIPAPTRWRWKLEKNGQLRASTRDQMHFIGRAMIAKGWLDPAALPAADALRIALAGGARDALTPSPTLADTIDVPVPDSTQEVAPVDTTTH
jgi:hypothetical protein